MPPHPPSLFSLSQECTYEYEHTHTPPPPSSPRKSPYAIAPLSRTNTHVFSECAVTTLLSSTDARMYVLHTDDASIRKLRFPRSYLEIPKARPVVVEPAARPPKALVEMSNRVKTRKGTHVPSDSYTQGRHVSPSQCEESLSDPALLPLSSSFSRAPPRGDLVRERRVRAGTENETDDVRLSQR